MLKLTALALVALVANPAMAQARKGANQWFEGASISVGASSNKSSTTTASGVQESGSSSVGVAKLSYTFASDSRYKLGVSASANMKKSAITNTISVGPTFPSELNIEPSFLVAPNLMSYAKLGVFAASYDTQFGSKNFNGSSYGVGVKYLLTYSLYLQGELTQHTASGSTTTGWDKYKQNSTSVMLGYYY